MVPLDVDLVRVNLEECRGAEIVRSQDGIAVRVLAEAPVQVAFPMR